MRLLKLETRNVGAGSSRNWQRIQAVHLNPDQADPNYKPNNVEIIQNKKAA